MFRPPRACAALAAATLVLLLAGCVEVKMDLTVSPNDQVDGAIVMAVDRSFVPPGDENASALVDQVRRSTFYTLPTGAKEAPYSDATHVGTRVTISQMTLLDFDRGTGDGGVKIAHRGGHLELSGTVDTTAIARVVAAASPAEAQRMEQTFDVRISVTFPGRVVRSNGQAQGRTVTWRPRLGERLQLVAEAEDAGSGVDWGVLVAVLLAAGLAGAAAVAVWPRRNRLRGG